MIPVSDVDRILSSLEYIFIVYNSTEGYHRSELKFSDISNLIGEDWEALAEKLGIRSSECKVIKIENPEGTARQSSVMLKQWNQRAGTKATGMFCKLLKVRKGTTQ